MTPLRQRMLNDMTVRGLAENTKKSYLASVTGLARHYRRSPDQISAQEVQDYLNLIHLHEQRGLSWKSCNCVRHGVRFLYRITLGMPDPHFYLPGAKTPSTLPEILNHDELVRLFTVAMRTPRTSTSRASSSRLFNRLSRTAAGAPGVPAGGADAAWSSLRASLKTTLFSSLCTRRTHRHSAENADNSLCPIHTAE